MPQIRSAKLQIACTATGYIVATNIAWQLIKSHGNYY